MNSSNGAFDMSSPTQNSKSMASSLFNETYPSTYDSALESLTAFNSFNESANHNSLAIVNPTSMTASTTAISGKLIQSESTEEVDPKSQLANKTIFRSNNPNLSIIEISDTFNIEVDVESSVFLVEASPTESEMADRFGLKWNQPSNQIEGPETLRKMQAIMQRPEESTSELSSSGIELGTSKAKEPKKNRSSDSESDSLPVTKRPIPIYRTIDEFERNLPETVTVLDTPFGSKVYLVGTAHFSEDSQDDVSLVIRNVRPDVVMVELCPSRIHILKLDEKTLLEEAKSFNIPKVRNIIQSHGYINGIFFMLLLQMSAQIAKDLGMAPGGEFRRAFEEIHKLPGCMLHLGDRPIRVTLHRALRALSLWQTIKLVWRLTSTESISIEEVEECKQKDLLEKLMEEMAGEFPAFSEVFVKERDTFLCHSLQLASLPQHFSNGLPRPVRVVGVVGIGHADGIAKLWGNVNPNSIPKIMEIPPARLSTRIFTFTVKYGIIGLISFGAYKFFRPRIGRLF